MNLKLRSVSAGRSAIGVFAVAWIAFTLFCGESRAVNDVIAQWTYEANTPADAMDTLAGPSVLAEAGAQAGTASMAGLHVDATTDWTTPVGNGSANSYSANGWGVGDYLQFQMSTTGFTDIGINFTSASSSTGPKDFKIEYATSEAGPYTPTNVEYTNQVSTNPVSWSGNANFYHPNFDKYVDLSSIDAIENQATLFFRFTQTSAAAAGGGTPAATGTSRIDNISFLGAYVPFIYGDYSDNKIVDDADYVVWRDNFTDDATPNVFQLTNEVPGVTPGTVTTLDYSRWREAYGVTVLKPVPPGSGLGAGSAVPEPSTAILLLVGLVALRSRRRATI